jgi:hypothetical protein
MRRIAIAAAVAGIACAGVAIVALPADAADNMKISGSFSFIDDSLCVDPIQVASSYDETMHVYYANDGTATRLDFTGTVTITYTDIVSGSTYTPNSSGPGTIDLATGQTIARGGNGAIFTDHGLLATDGKLVLDAAGNVVSLPHHTTDVCVALGTSSIISP